MLNSLIKYAKGQGEKGVNNLQKIKDYLGEENNAFLEMQILNKLFKESVVENDRASLRVFDSESFLGRVRELVGENELYERKIGKEFLEELSPSAMPKQISIDEFLNTLENFKNKENFLKHIEKDPKRKDYLNLIEPTLKEPDIAFKKLENGVEKEKFIKKFSDGKDFFYLLATKDNKETILTAFKTDKINTILKEFNADIIPTFIRQGSKGKAAGTTNEGIITQPLFKSKEAREFLELVEGFHKLYKNDASIAKNLVQGTASQLSTSIATSAEGAIKQKVVKGGFDPIFRLLPDGILFGLFSKQIQGGALRYHLKKALSRSLNYDDFKIKLEKELKRTNFNSNTSRLIDEFMQNLEDFNREKEQFLEAKRIEQARIKEEERKRAEEIYKRQEANNLKDILEAEEKPLKDEFGVNFEGFKGKEAIEKLLEEQRGQVKGAFYKEGLGEIDLVWGDENFGLRHIIEQRTKQWGEEKALKFISHLNENIEKGQIVEVQKGRAAIKTDLTTIILDKKENNNFVLTAFRDRNNKKELESLNLSQSKTFTSENAEANAKESPVTSLNQESIIAQKAKNDEVLEAEVIEEVGLNEPMKFLEFQQRKLLTYIKENTPLRLLEHKKELKTRDILNFLEQSALNGKQKVFLMRNLERDLGKIELKIKENESVKAKIKNTYEISQSEAKELGEHFNFKGKKPLLRELRENEIKHALKSHGNKESEEARGNIAITLQDIEANYPKITQEFDEKFFTQKGVIYVKQVNGHHIVIEEALSGQDKLIFKTMWKTKGNYNKEVLLKNTKTSPYPQNADEAVRLETISKQELEQSNPQQSHLSTDESIAQKAKKAEFESFKDKIKELYTKYEGLNHYDKSASQLKSKLLNEEIKPEIKKEFKNIIDKFKGADNKDKMLRVIKENKEELSDYLAFNIALRKDIYIDGYGVGKYDFYDKLIRNFFKLRENKPGSEISDDSNYRALAALENLSNKNTSLYFSFKDLNGKVGEIKTYPRIQDLLFYDLILGYDLKNAVILSTKDKHLKEKLIEKLKAYIDKKIYADFLEYKIKDLESRNPKNSFFENYKDEKWDEEALKSFKKELEDLRANEKAQKLEAKGSEDIIFTDKKGKEHTLTKETQKAWLEAFNLKSLEDSYIPNHNEAIKQALEGKEIKLQLGSLKKLVAQGREKYIPQIKEVLDRPEAIMRDDMGEYLFIKHLKDDDYFVNVSFDNGEYLVSISNGIKETRNLNNKLKKGGEFIYQSPNFNFISQKLLQTSQYSANKIDEDIIAQNAKRAEFESFKDKIKELYTKYEGLNPYDKSASQLKSKLLNEEIKPEIKKEFKNIIDKFKGADNKDKMLRVIKENKEELSDYLAFHIALRKDIYIDGYGEGKVDFYDKSIRDFIKFRENKQWSEIDESKYRALAALENLSNKNTSLYFSFRDLNGKIEGFKTYPRIQDLLFDDLTLGDDFKSAMLLSTKDKQLKEKLNEKLKTYIDEKLYRDFLQYKIEDLESKNPKNSFFENYENKKWDEEALGAFKNELEDLRAKESAKGENESVKAWLEAFNLRSIEEEASVEIPADIKEHLGKEIKLNKKDFEKLVKNKREKYIEQIKETFKEPEAVFIDENDDLIFAKSFNDKLFFVNVNRDYGEAFKALSLAPKKNNNLLNKLNKAKEILKLDSKLRDYTAQQAFTGVLSASNKSSGEIIPQIPKDNSQLNVLHTKIQQVRQQIAESKNPDKEYLHQVFKPDEIIELEKQYFNQAMPQEYKELIQDFPQLYEQRLANELKAYVKDTDVIQEVSAQLLNDFKDKSFKDTAKHAELLLFNTLRDKAQELGFKELDINEPSFKVAFGKFQAKLKKGDIQDLSEHIAINSLQHDRLRIQEALNITPLKEFGTNYAEFYRDGKGAVEKLLAEKQGQVAGAFYKEGLGEIDLVWGDENFGLRHIIDKHGDEFEDIAAELDEIIAKGVLEKGEHRYFIKHNDYKGMIALDYKGKESNAWILTLYKDKSALNPAYQHQIKHNTNTSSETRANGEFENSNIKNANLQKEKVDKLFHGDAEVISAQGKFNELEALNLTDEDIIPQQKIKFAMEKFHYDEKKAKDLLEWHKNSHALTKDENGLPKVFYHGTYSKFRVFRRVGKASGQGFFFTPSQKATEEYGDITLNTFLNIKNPFRADELKINKGADLQKWADILKLDYDKEKYESFKDLKTKLEKVKEATKKAGFKFHSASGGGVYVIDNKGRNSFINLEELDKENKRVVEAFKGLETEDIYFYYVVRNEFDLVLYALNKNDRYFHTSGRDEVKRVLEKLGYDGVVLNDTIITVFNSNQIKHIDNKGSFTDTKGNVTSKKPKDKEAEFSYFNEKSDNIYHSNPHLGAGLVGGVL
ncbi:hypothetical protein ABHN87_000124, partial [Campylobacter upsaliensis]